MLTELIHVGHSYRTNAGDLVEIVERTPDRDSEGRHVHKFSARVLETINGHERWIGKIMKFDREGHWISPEGVTMLKAIHNLHEEACVHV